MFKLRIGQNIKLNFTVSSFKDVNIICKIKRVENDRLGLVFPEESLDFIKELPEGREIEAIVYLNSGIFVFDSIVINSPLENDFVIELPDEQQKIQRREYIRAPINLKLVLSGKNINIETKTLNIGGGGIRFIANEDFKSNDIWDFILYMPDKYVIKGAGKILYVLLQGKITASVITFADISETDRNKIIKQCFDEEIRNLKARKIV